MQEDSAIEIGAEPSNINLMGVNILYAFNSQRICSAKLYALRSGRHGGQRERLAIRASRTRRQQKRPIYSAGAVLG